MNHTIKIYCSNIHRHIEIAGGSRLSEIYSLIKDELDFSPICAFVNNHTEDLNFPVYAPKVVKFLDASTPSGTRVYTRSLCMILFKAVCDLLPGHKVRIEHSISGGQYCRLFDPEGNPMIPSADIIARLLEEMKLTSKADIPFTRKEKLTKDVKKLFHAMNLDDKILLLDTLHHLYTPYYTLGDICDSYYGPLAPTSGLIDVFNLIPYKEGMLLLGPDPADRTRPRQMIVQEKMYSAFTDYQKFNRIIRVSNVGELNKAVQSRQTVKLINVAEAMHDKYLGQIADEIARRHNENGTSVVLIAGPSSSGKTTTAKRLGIHLMTNLLVPKTISLDDYFVNREQTPRDETGDYDYEHLHALDLERFNSDLNALLRGETINLPTYSFEFGRRVERDRPLSLSPDEILVIEGIHGLNPELTSSIPSEKIFKVYVSALTTLSIDDHNWIPTTDNRLLRRIVRDHKYRHTSALETIRRWPSVRRGEEKWIFPFQENADATFNSSLIFELGVMKEYAIPMLRDVPHDEKEYAEAYRLMRFLDCFEPIPADQIPADSLLREFLGGSAFRY